MTTQIEIRYLSVHEFLNATFTFFVKFTHSNIEFQFCCCSIDSFFKKRETKYLLRQETLLIALEMKYFINLTNVGILSKQDDKNEVENKRV